MKNKLGKILFAFISLGSLLAFNFALAQTTGDQTGSFFAEQIGLVSGDPRVIIASVIRIALGFLGIISVILIIYGGWMYMISEGDSEKVNKAKRIIINAIIGLLIIVSAFAITSFILNSLNQGGGNLGGGSCSISADCPSGLTCCSGTCQSQCAVIPGGCLGSNCAFGISGVAPVRSSTNNVRNSRIKIFFNRGLSTSLDSTALVANFSVKKIGDVNSQSGQVTALGEAVRIDGVLIPKGGEINFTADGACGDALGTASCLPEWSQFKVLVNQASGIKSINNESLDCANGVCEFVFSTNDSIDTSAPISGITPDQICQDDGTLKPEANIIAGWGGDDFGLSALKFYSQLQGGEEKENSTIPGNGGQSQTAYYHYDTSKMKAGDRYTFRIKAYDLADQSSQAEFSTTVKPGHCCNGKKDGNESDVDCGGDCLACVGGSCSKASTEQCGENNSNCDNDLCSTFFCDCQTDACLCASRPVIKSVSPLGGFCSNNNNQFCKVDSDCGSGKCDSGTPNGKAGNIITISGSNFGTTEGEVFFTKAGGGQISAVLSATANSNCVNTWQNNLITAIVPAGAVSGPITIKNIRGLSDATNDSNGPAIPNFALNEIARPGICQLAPDHGKQNDAINFFGLNLTDGQTYFGDLINNVSSLVSNTSDSLLQTTVPSLEIGLSSAFVLNKQGIPSNYLNFIKDSEPYTGPLINYFQPEQGAPGQYVTIYGQGFGGARSAGTHVYFGNQGQNEASYKFPDVCADTVWSDQRIVVKVPDNLADGNYKITLEIPNSKNANVPFVVNSAGLSSPYASVFKADKSLVLSPSLCKINPLTGPRSSVVSLWGEYFGSKGTGAVRFYQNQEVAGALTSFWGNEGNASKVELSVPVGATTGPVQMVQSNLAGNSLNFTVGSCLEAVSPDTACGGGKCCPADSSYSGQCKAGLNDCYVGIKSCVYEFDFSTASSAKLGDPCYNGAVSGVCDLSKSKCSGNLTCDNSTCTCQGGNGYSCDSNPASASCEVGNVCAVGYSCDTTNCVCKKTQTCFASQESCGDVCCAKSAGGCEDPLKSKCKNANPGQYVCDDGTCSKPCEQGSDGNTLCPDPLSSCSGYNNNQCANSLYCPNSPGNCSLYQPASNAVKVIGACNYSCSGVGACADGACTYGSDLNKCILNNKTCDLNSTAEDVLGQNVQTYCNSDGRWQFDSPATCPDGWQETYGNHCIKLGDTGVCELCSDGYACFKRGSAVKGVCAVNQIICPYDSTCNSNNQCVKAEQTNCQCCCDKTQNKADGTNQACCAPLTCANTCGTGGNNGLCSGCASVGTTQAQHDSACNCTGTSGKYCDTSISGGVCRDCNEVTSGAECSSHSACCVDATRSNACRATGNVPNISQNGLSYCSYYQCNAGNQGCDTANKVIAPTTGNTAYYSFGQCQTACQPPAIFGDSCNSSAKSTISQCDLSQCSNFSCLNSDGSAPSAPSQCGSCCCDPAKTGDELTATNFDSCNLLNTNGVNLTCKPNQTPCSGDKRGLCCGCSSDSQCDNGTAYGCGTDTCCHNRPSIVSTFPVNGADQICRNIQIQATASELLDPSTLSGNVLVAGDYGDDNCPASSQLLAFGNSQPNRSALVVTANKVKRLAKNIFRPLVQPILGDTALADSAHNFCAVAGTVSSYNTSGGKTIISFAPTGLLDSSRSYYVILKGDTNLDSKQGIKNTQKIGLKGINETSFVQFNGLNFPQAQIWSFTTMDEGTNSGICELNEVKISPSAYLFNTNINNIAKENDNNLNNATFDTMADSDKVFTAVPLSADGQILNPVAGYSWTYNWAFDTSGIVEIVNDAGLDANGSRQLLRANDKISDGSTILRANLKINNGQRTVSGSASITVFLCQNPWPAIKANGEWLPWIDQKQNCNVPNSGDCAFNGNYKLYYCRDAGNASTMTDDLPAILDEVKTRGKSFVCSYGVNAGQACNSNEDCDGALCKQVLKETYFFQE